MALPVLSQGKDRDFSIRAQCANQIRQIVIAMTAYAQDNHGNYPSERAGRSNQRTLNPVVPPKYKADFFLAPNMTNGVNRIWCCPSCYDTTLPVYQANEGNWLLGYNYYGGISNWVNVSFPNGTPSYSPIKLSQSHPTWVLASDCMNNYVAGGLPGNWQIDALGAIPHRRPGTLLPDGGNEGFVDGSVTWVKLETTLQLTEFDSTYEHDFMYQSELPPTFNKFVLKELAPP